MVIVGNKRPNDDVEEFARANASNITQRVEGDPDAVKRYKGIYKCKEKGCDKEYDSFQALGGHRASHKNFRILHTGSTKSLPKLHRCKSCGMGFPIGQSLGGHMRKHRQGKLEVNKAMVLRHRQEKLEDNKAMVLRLPVDSMSSTSSGVINLSSKKALEFDLNMMPQEKEEVNVV